MNETVKVGKRGAVVIPAKMRRKFGMDEGALLIIEDEGNRLAMRPAVAVPLEIYPAERKAEFLLQNAVDEKDYLRALREVKSMGLNPAKIRHTRP